MSRSIRTLMATSLVATLAFASTAAAQAPSTLDSSTDTTAVAVPRSAPVFGSALKTTFSDFRRLPSMDTLTWISVGAIAAGFSTKIDHSATNRMQGSPMLDTTLAPGKILGGKEFQFGSALATYAIGRISGHQRISDVGGRLLRAQFMAQTVTGAIKFSANRTRPDGTSLSFPSGHTSVSFASATVLQKEFGWKAGIPAYAVASYIGMSRIEDKRHFLSDVAFGAAIGIVSGRTVTVGRGDKRFAVAPMASTSGVGVGFNWLGK